MEFNNGVGQLIPWKQGFIYDKGENFEGSFHFVDLTRSKDLIPCSGKLIPGFLYLEKPAKGVLNRILTQIFLNWFWMTLFWVAPTWPF
jgi:hypothetical protein